MGLTGLVLLGSAAVALAVAAGCAKGSEIEQDGSGVNTTSGAGGEGGGAQGGAGGTSCGEACDQDGDGVVDDDDVCPDTPSGETVNSLGCSDSQVDPALQPEFPPYGLSWTPTGDIGRPGGLTWTYTDIDRGDLFHIYWVLCDDPGTPCGVSLDGPIDAAGEQWQLSAADSDLAGGTMVFSNATNIVLDDSSTPAVTGRLTISIVDENNDAIPFADLATLGVPGADGEYGAEIPGTGFVIAVIIEIEDGPDWTPYLDYFDNASTLEPGPGNAVSFGGSFYDE